MGTINAVPAAENPIEDTVIPAEVNAGRRHQGYRRRSPTNRQDLDSTNPMRAAHGHGRSAAVARFWVSTSEKWSICPAFFELVDMFRWRWRNAMISSSHPLNTELFFAAVFDEAHAIRKDSVACDARSPVFMLGRLSSVIFAVAFAVAFASVGCVRMKTPGPRRRDWERPPGWR